MTEEIINKWLVAKVSGYLSISSHEVDQDRSLADYGLDSVNAITLCGEIEDEFGLVVDDTLAWDYPTINAMSEHLGALLCTEV